MQADSGCQVVGHGNVNILQHLVRGSGASSRLFGNCVVSGFPLCTAGHRLRQRAASRVWPLDHLAYLLP